MRQCFSFHLLMGMLKQQITEVDRNANAFLWELGFDILVDRELRSEADGVVAINPQSRWTQKDLVCLAVCEHAVGLLDTAKSVHRPVRRTVASPTSRAVYATSWPIAIDQAVIEHGSTLTS